MNKLLTSVLVTLILITTGCSSGGGGGGGGGGGTTSQAVNTSGSGVKGPLANADVAFYEFDSGQPDFRAATAAATGRTNSAAAFENISLGSVSEPPNPPYIVVFSETAAATCAADPATCTTDITTGAPPVIKTMITVATADMLLDANDDGVIDETIYATPLTTMAVKLAVKNADTNPTTSGDANWPYNGDGDGSTTVEEFLAALDVAKEQVTSSFGFGVSENVDIFRTPPLVNASTDQEEELAGVTEYRSAVEALSAVVYQMDQQSSGTTTDQMLDELSNDLADGEVDGTVDGAASTVINSSNLEVLDQEPSTLPIPGTNITVGDIKTVLDDEKATTGATTDTTALAAVTVVLKPAEPDSDLDDDGILNFKDAFPTDAARDKDTDKDGLADDVWELDGSGARTGSLDATAVDGVDVDNDDDNDGVPDSADAWPVDAARDTDTDGDGLANKVWALDSNNARTGNLNTAVLADDDDDDDGMPDVNDDFPLDATKQNASDQDNDGWDAAYDPNDADANNPGVTLASQDPDGDGIPNSFDSDDDGDGVADATDACPLDASGAFDTDGDTICDANDPDKDEDGVANASDAFPLNPGEDTDTDGDGTGDNSDTDADGDGILNSFEDQANNCNLLRDCDGDGRLDPSDRFPTDSSEYRDFDGDGTGDNADTDDDNDGLSDTDEAAKGTKQFIADTDGDGALDGADALPLDPAEQLDTDADGAGNNADTDDDNDGVADADDDFPLDPNRSSLSDQDSDGWPNGWDLDDSDANNPGAGFTFVDTDGDGVPNTDATGAQADADDDSDGVADALDAFPLDSTESKDTDSDGTGNNADTDDDGDGTPDASDAFPLISTESADADGDGVGNSSDPDDDNDGTPDASDAFPTNPNENTDTDSDGTGNNADTDDDNDGVADASDAFPLNASESVDTDNDGTGNNADTDDDNDGVLDASDALPLNASESVDTDSDGTGNNADTDDDNDGVADVSDAFPLNASESVDTDGDTIGNNADTDDDNDGTLDVSDDFPLDAAENTDTDNDGTGNNADTDDDNDGVADASDAFPLNASESVDTDGDTIGNNADTDDDNDGTLDVSDDFPLDAAENTDTDNDGTGNNADTDDDGDGVADGSDAFPLDVSESVDTDSDGTGNNADTDDDNDSTPDVSDDFPLDAAENTDTDNDGTGNNADTDDDNDSVADASEANATCQLLVDCDSDGVNDNADAFPTNASETVDTDSDGTGNNADTDDDNDGTLDVSDDFPLDAAEDTDTDNDGTGNNADTDDDGDGVADGSDAFPLDNGESVDTDSDGAGNNADADDDNDGVPDVSDDLPLDASESVDTDNDGTGNNADTDDDNDGVADGSDVFPLDAAESVDTDSDGAGNNADTDDDGDGVADGSDAFPLDNSEFVDTDSDGTGNNADTDDDNDTVLDVNEANVSCQLLVDCDSDGVNDNLDAFPVDPAETADSDGDGTGNNADVCPNDPATATDPLVCAGALTMEQVLTNGISWFDGWAEHDDFIGYNVPDYNYGNLQWDGVSAFSVDEEFKYNKLSGAFEADTGGDNDVYLIASGWLAPASVVQSATMNPDGTATFETRASGTNELLEQELISVAATATDLDGVDMTTVLYEGAAWALALPPGATFSTGAEAFDITITGQMDAYRIWCGDTIDPVTGDGCETLAIDWTQSGPVYGTALTEVLHASTGGGASPVVWVGQLGNGNYVQAEFVGPDANVGTNGTVNYFEFDQTGQTVPSLLGSGSFNVVEPVTGAVVMSYSIPAGVASQLVDEEDLDRFLTVYNGFVRPGDKQVNGGSKNELILNYTARNQVLAVFDATVVDGHSLAMDTVLTPPGMSWIDAYNYGGGIDYEYGTISYDGGTTSDISYHYDTGSSSFVESTANNAVVLGNAGWSAVTDQMTVSSINGDGTAVIVLTDGSENYKQYLASSQRYGILGNPLVDLLGRQHQDWTGAVVPNTAVFSSGAEAYALNLVSQMDSYEIDCDGSSIPGGDNCSAVQYDNAGSLEYATSLAQLLVASSQGDAVLNEKFVGNTMNGNVRVELVGTTANSGDSGVTNFFEYPNGVGSVAPIGSPGTWSAVTVNGEVLLTFTIPQDVMDQMFENNPNRFFAVYNGYVREGESTLNGTVNDGEDGPIMMFNNVALNDILTNFVAQTGGGIDADGDGVDDDVDNCLGVNNPDQADANTNGIGDACEGGGGGGSSAAQERYPDSDGDGVPDGIDAFPTDPARDADTDGDGLADDVWELDVNNVRTGALDAMAVGVDDDDDGDGILDVSDNCPLVDDGGANSATACDNSAFVGSHQINFTITDLTATTEPSAGYCADGDIVGGTGSEYVTFHAAADTAIIVNGGDGRGVYNSDNGNFTLNGSHSHDEYIETVGNVTITESFTVNGTFNAGTWTGTYNETKTSSGGAVNCSRTESFSGTLLYQFSGTEDYNGVYQVEVLNQDWNPATDSPMEVRSAAVIQIDHTASDIALYFDGPMEVLSSSFDPVSGLFMVEALSEETVQDRDGDTVVDDLVRQTMKLYGRFVRAPGASSVVQVVLEGSDSEEVYLDQTVYTPGDTPSQIYGAGDFEAYGRVVTPSGYSRTVRNNSGTDGIQLGILNPPLKRTGSELYLQVLDTDGTTELCNVAYGLQNPGTGRFRIHQTQPASDFYTEGFRSGAYSFINCDTSDAGTDTVFHGNSYTLRVIDAGANGVLDTLDGNAPVNDDVAVMSSPIVFAAQVVDQVERFTLTPDRATITVNNAAPSQSMSGGVIPLYGLFNVYNPSSWAINWTDLGDGETSYQVRVQDVYGFDRIRIDTPDGDTTTVTLDATQMDAYDNVNVHIAALKAGANSAQAMAFSSNLQIQPGLRGLIQVETDHPDPAAGIFQVYVEASLDGWVSMCTVMNRYFTCNAGSSNLDVATNTLTLSINDDGSGALGAPGSYNVVMQFSDSVNASIAGGTGMPGTTLGGSAKVVNPELVVQSRLSGGNQSTNISLNNVLPTHRIGTLTTASGSVALDTVPNTSFTLWDDMDGNGANNLVMMMDSFMALPFDGAPQDNSTYVAYNSMNNGGLAAGLLAVDTYKVTLSSSINGSSNLVFAVDYAAPTPSTPAVAKTSVSMQGSGDGSMTAVQTGVNDTAATAIAINGSPIIQWTVPTTASTMRWQMVLFAVDGSNVAETHHQFRTIRLQVTDTDLAYVDNGNGTATWTWTAPSYFVLPSGQIYRVQIRSSDDTHTMQGFSQNTFLQTN